jgi:hypothetical protein
MRFGCDGLHVRISSPASVSGTTNVLLVAPHVSGAHWTLVLLRHLAHELPSHFVADSQVGHLQPTPTSFYLCEWKIAGGTNDLPGPAAGGGPASCRIRQRSPGWARRRIGSSVRPAGKPTDRQRLEDTAFDSATLEPRAIARRHRPCLTTQSKRRGVACARSLNAFGARSLPNTCRSTHFRRCRNRGPERRLQTAARRYGGESHRKAHSDVHHCH